MNPIEEIKARLTKYSEVAFRETSDSIEVLPRDESGFTVGLYVAEREAVVHFDGWHEHFSSAEDALECFAFGLSSACRLRVECRGMTAVKWTVESLDEGAWVEDGTTGLLLTPFWRSRSVLYKQNHLIDCEESTRGSTG